MKPAVRRSMMASLFVVALCLSLAAGAQAPGGGGGRTPGVGGPPIGRAPGMPPGVFPGGGPGGNGPGGNGPGANGAGGVASTGGGNGNVAGGGPGRTTSVTSRSGLRLGPPGRWWDNSAIGRQIGLSHDQQRRMDAIFDTNKPAILDTYKTFTAQQSRLAAISKDPKADKAQLFAAIDAVNQARAALEKANTQMLLQVRGQLEPAQVTKLDALP